MGGIFVKRFVLFFLTPFLLLAACDQGPGPGDNIDPTVEVMLGGTTNAAGAYMDSVEVTIKAAAKGNSSLSKTEYSLDGSVFQAYTQPFDIITPGKYTLVARATDAAGRVGKAEETFTVAKSGVPEETVAPTVQITLNGTANASGVYEDSVEVTLEASDTGGSGLAKTEYSLNGSAFQTYSQPLNLTTPGEYTVEARATDNAGNVGESEETFTVANSNAPADAIDPTVSLTLGGTTDASGAYQGSATVTITAADEGGSGLAATEYSLDGEPFVAYSSPVTVTTSGEHTVVARASDEAGNTTTTEPQMFTVAGGTTPGDTTDPTVSASADGAERSSNVFENSATVTITAADEGGSGLAKTEYSLDGDPFQDYETPFTVTSLGNHTVVAKATDGAGNAAESTLTFQVVSGGTPTAPTPNAAEVTLNNLDGAPYDDRLVFSRIQKPEDGANPYPDGTCCRLPNVVHDMATVRITNTGSAPLEITALPVEGPWTIESTAPAVSLPTTVPVNSSLDLTLKFVATGGDLNTGTLTVVSSASGNQYEVVELAGFWQEFSERNREPNLRQLVDLFGYETNITNANQALNNKGRVEAVGDEVLSPYWRRADASKPVTVRQLAAYHVQGRVTSFYWYEKEGYSKPPNSDVNRLFVHDEEEGQTVLPSRIGNSTTPVVGTFAPDGVFGFKVDNEWSDWTLNTTGTDEDIDGDCLRAQEGNPSIVCGHHVRFWKVKDRAGNVVPNTYLLGMDYAGINYDFNDNLYLISNIEPSDEGVPYRIDVAGNGSYTSGEGIWYTDVGSGLFRPESAPAERPGSTAIAGTDDDQLYWTYRGNVGSSTPQNQRQLVYNLPLNAGTYDLTLYFAERFHNQSGKRVFDVSVEGTLRLDDFDIFGQSGGKNTAITETFSNISVTDGNLTIVFDPSVDFASISAIKVTR